MCAQHQHQHPQQEDAHLISRQIRDILANFKKKALTFYRERRGLAELIVAIVAGTTVQSTLKNVY